jgi:hypothetical protein
MLSAALLAGIGALSPVRVIAPPAFRDAGSGPSRRSGKGKGRHGARKPMQHVRTARPPAGKTARRRRRAANLRRS